MHVVITSNIRHVYKLRGRERELVPTPFQPPDILFQMADDVVFQTKCIAAVVGHLKWRKVTAIYENHGFYTAGAGITLTLLSDSLRLVNSEKITSNSL